jgi:hypothetical protein
MDGGGTTPDATSPAEGGGQETSTTEDAVGPDVMSTGETSTPDTGVAPDVGTTDSGKGDAASDATGGSTPDAATDASCATSSVTDYCSSIPALPAAPVIDGVLDCGPPLLNMTPQGWSGPSPLPAFPAGNSASIAAAWRSNGLYVFVQVTTPVVIAANSGDPPFYGSAAEIYVDSDGSFAGGATYDNPGAIQLVAAAPQSGSTTARVGEGYRNAAAQGAWAGTQFEAFITSGGFILEAFITAADLGLSSWSLSSGNHIGFDIAVDVSFTTTSTTGPQGHREGQYYLHVGGSSVGAPYADPRSFCTPALQ